MGKRRGVGPIGSCRCSVQRSTSVEWVDPIPGSSREAGSLSLENQVADCKELFDHTIRIVHKQLARPEGEVGLGGQTSDDALKGRLR